jgi:hypothetical protein
MISTRAFPPLLTLQSRESDPGIGYEMESCGVGSGGPMARTDTGAYRRHGFWESMHDGGIRWYRQAA